MNFLLRYSKSILLFALICLLISCEQAADSPYPPISFERIAPLPGTGRASAVAFVLNNQAYVTLGRSGYSPEYSKQCWVYNPTSNKWSQGVTFPGSARVKAVSSVVNGIAYVGLGYQLGTSIYSGGCLKDFWSFNATSNSWERKADIPTSLTNACFCFVLNNCIYVGAGFSDGNFGTEFWKYNPELNTWTQMKDLSGISRAGSIACSNGDRSFYGTGFHMRCTNDWWEYRKESDTWKKCKSLPDAGRQMAVSFSLNNRFFVSTGRYFRGNLTGGHVDSDVLEYDANKDVWYDRGSFEGGRENAIYFTINGKAYIGLGENDSQVLSDIWRFEP